MTYIDPESRDGERRDPAGAPCGPKIVTLKVDKVWKGDVGSETKVFAGDGCAGRGGHFRERTHYLVVARRLDENEAYPGRPSFSSSICAGTSPISVAKERGDLKWLNENAEAMQ